jgi:hypothetical protein
MTRVKKERIKNSSGDVIRLKLSDKVVWLSKEEKRGWSLGLALGTQTLWLKRLRMPDLLAVRSLLKVGLVSVALKNKK